MNRLIQMMEDREYQKCLKLAEQQLFRGGYSLSQLAQINFIICRCRLGLHDAYGAIPSGLLAMKLARDLREWDTLGRILVNVGNAFVGAKQYDQALRYFYDYFEHLPQYTEAADFEGAVWKGIGIVHQQKLESEKAIEALQRARAWFMGKGAEYSAFTCTNDLVNIYLQIHEKNPGTSLQPVMDLLQFEKELARKYPTNVYYRSIYLHDLAVYYMHNRRYDRAVVSAMKALRINEEDTWVAFHCHMILHSCMWSLGNTRQALGYALVARVEAIKGHHDDLELLATQAMIQLIRHQDTEVVRELDEEYQAMGIDLSQHLPVSLLGRGN